MKKLVGTLLTLCALTVSGQVDTSYVFNTSTPYGTLDIRLAKSATRYYYLQENVTFSFRESAPGVKTNTYRNMTSFDSSPYTEGNLRERSGFVDYFIMNYRLLFPLNYNASYAKGYPLILMMHGLGERANCWDANCYWATTSYDPNTNSPAAPTTSTHNLLNNDHNLSHGGAPHLAARNLAGNKLPDDPTLPPRAFPGFVLFPQNMNGWNGGNTQDVIRIVRLLMKKHNIDPDRIYIHGLSNGGAAVYDAIKRAPWLFAGALTMSAISDGTIISSNSTHLVHEIPIWTFQGGQDTNPTPSKTQGYVTKFRAAGMDVRYSYYPTLGHGTWNTAYNEPDFFTWMLTKNKRKIHVPFGIPVICGTNGKGVDLSLSPGFRAYQWERNGQIIPGATSNKYTANVTGVYRARFSRVPNPTAADWNAWSDPVEIGQSSPPKPVIQITGTQFMRGPDGNALYNTVYLTSTTHDKYFWYRNGALVNIPNTTVDDTTRVFKITSTSNSTNGAYTVQTQGNDLCPSPMSDPVNIYFANSGPFLADSNIPTNFSGVATSPSTAQLTWTDKSAIETGYEIWRRKPGGIFMLVGKTGPNATSFLDTGMEPSVAYQYKLRAFNATGRTKFAPSDNVNTNLVVSTAGDNQVPTVPTNLQVTGNTISTISLSWTASTDNTGIKRYHITYGNSTIVTPTNATTFTLENLPINTAYHIKVAAEDLGGNMSGQSSSVVGSTFVTGLIYNHSTGAWTSLDQINTWASPEFAGSVPNFTLAPRTQEDFFNFEFKGRIYITNGGNYEFNTTSDDGSRLWINGQLLVNNDGTHGNKTVNSNPVALSSGAHEIQVRYFEYTGGQTLTVQYRGPDTGNSWVTIPDNVLKSGPSVPVPQGTAMANLGAVVVLEEPGKQPFNMKLYPNPSTSDNVFVNFEPETDDPVEVSMVNLVGKSYFRQTVAAEDARGGIHIRPSSSLTNGIYVVMVNQGSRLAKEKIVIQN